MPGLEASRPGPRAGWPGLAASLEPEGLAWRPRGLAPGQNFAKGKMTFERSKPERSYIRATLLACVALQLLAQLLTLAAPSGSAGWLAWPGHWLAGLAWPGKA